LFGESLLQSTRGFILFIGRDAKTHAHLNTWH